MIESLADLLFDSAPWRPGRNRDAALALLLGLHACLSLMVAAGAAALIPRRGLFARRRLLLLFLAIGYGLPGLGYITVLWFALLLRRAPEKLDPDRLQQLTLPDFDPHQRIGHGFRQAGIRAFLGNTAAPTDNRLRALVALQNLSGRLTTPLLRSVLADANEDLRLLAYGMLDAREKTLNAAIHDARTRLSYARDIDDRRLLARKLSDLYWELVHQELVQGDLRRHALDESWRYALEAIDDRDAALALRLGRIAQQQHRPDVAQTYFERALALGMPGTRVLPYLAELAFEQGDFATTRARLARLAGVSVLPRLEPVVAYWSRA